MPVLRPKTFVGPERLGIWSILYDWAHSGSGFPADRAGAGTSISSWTSRISAMPSTPRMIGDADDVNDVFNVGAKIVRQHAR